MDAYARYFGIKYRLVYITNEQPTLRKVIHSPRMMRFIYDIQKKLHQILFYDKLVGDEKQEPSNDDIYRNTQAKFWYRNYVVNT